MRVVVGAAAARAHGLLDGTKRGLGGRVLRGGQLRHPRATAVHALVDVARKLADLRADRVHDEGGLGDAPADVRVVGVGRLVLHRAALRHVLGGHLDRALADSLVGGGQQDLEVGEDAEDDRVGTRAGICDREDTLLGHGDALEQGRHGLGGAHTQRVPVVLDRVAFVVAVDDAEHGFGALLGLRAPEDEQARPHGGQGGEDLGAFEGVAAVCGRGRARRRTEEHEVVARLGDAEAKDLAGDRVAQDLLTARVAVGAQVAAEADDDLVHVDAQCRAGSGLGQGRLLGGDLGEAQARATELGGNEGRQVSGLA